ncbi:hypothetical protein [Amycolatopsis sp. BJA-103]|uniref:hypothetical protein n=1 Tax=unclassified Amycolatopsis TaxID=2618356 RepID=UPI000C76554A|nr:hypothetical protein [Amycolatopsis sp. BJA-103]AUI62474.1 hypothetical protein BKN51_32835 [Amycolatopsis sp. BJA-103]PNE18310.1 hypothetical protein B1H26_10515 [Amycolatopsis sp. BJA-103]
MSSQLADDGGGVSEMVLFQDGPGSLVLACAAAAENPDIVSKTVVASTTTVARRDRPRPPSSKITQ